MQLPVKKQELLTRIVSELKQVPGVAAVVLGGSHCTGMANESSDLDLGLYYHPSSPFSVDDIRTIANRFNVGNDATVTDFYGWGAWVNGGAWITSADGEVDILYRNISQVYTTIEKAKNGVWETDYGQQPPYGFSSIIYLAETLNCVALHDPDRVIEGLKKEVAVYPPQLKQAVVQQSLWAAQFALWQADKFAAKNDVYSATGCFTRISKNLTDALFALNERYPMGDKNALTILAREQKTPHGLEARIRQVLAPANSSLAESARLLRQVFEDTVSLAGNLYHPYFEL